GSCCMMFGFFLGSPHRGLLSQFPGTWEHPVWCPITPSPQGPTPFPYTTLFRSYADFPEQVVPLRSIGGGITLVGLSEGPTLAFKDRKSTRLNSSHVKISYAVFRLNKKTNVAHCHTLGYRRLHRTDHPVVHSLVE